MTIAMRALRFLPAAIFCLSPCAAASVELTPTDPGQFFFSPQQKAVLDLQAAADLQGKSLSYTISDYEGTIVSSAQVSVSAQGKVEIPLLLPRGYYEISFPDTAETFGLVSIEPYTGTPDPFFCIDASLSWLVPAPDQRPNLIALLKRSGFGTARERLGWPAINPKPGQWDWETPRQYDSLRKLYKNSGIGVLEINHQLPAWTNPLKGDRFPADLFLTGEAWKEIANRWQSCWGGLEIWNEPDTFNLPADLYLPLVKAMHYEFEKDKISVPLGGGVFAYFGKPYQDLAAQNGLLDEVDFVSFHFYDNALALDGHIANFRSWLKEFGAGSKPLWLTENGKAWDGVPGKPATLKLDQGRALDFAASAVEARACGVARYFPFILVPYSEKGHSNFGMIDAQGAPYRTLATYANATRLLSHKPYLGTLRLPDSALARTRVFAGQDGEVLIVLYAGPDGQTPRVKLPFPILSVCGADGRTITPDASGQILVSDGLVYVSAAAKEIASLLDTGSQATELYQISQQPSAPLPASPIILQPLLNLSTEQPSGRGYQLAEGITEIPIETRINNFSDQPKNVELQYGPLGTTTALQSEQVSVPASASIDVHAKIPLSSLPADASGVCVLQVTAKSPGIARIAPVAMNFIPSLGLEEYLKTASYKFTAPIGELNRWQKSANGTLTMETTPAVSWSMNVVFKGGDRWAYPKYAFPQEVDLDHVQGVLIRARCANPAAVRFVAWNKANKQFNTSYSIIPADGAWHVAYVPLDAFMKPEAGQDSTHLAIDLAKISVGLNSTADTNHLEISDLYFLGKQ